MKHLIVAILGLLDRAGVPYCVLHGWERLGEFPASDVDLAIRPQDLRVVERLLYGRNDHYCVQLHQYKSTGFCFTLAALDGQAVRFLRLDLTTHFRGKGRLFMSAAELMAGRRLVNGIWVASPAVELSYLLVKKVMKGAVPPFQKELLRALVGELGSEAAGIAARYFSKGWPQRFLSWIERGDWSRVEENFGPLKRSLLRRALGADPSRWFRYWLPELWRLWRRWLHPAGLFIAVLGPDGSGKSTLVRRLPAVLRPVFPRESSFHLRPGLMPAAGATGGTDDPHGRDPRGGFASLLKLLYLVLDFSLGYQLRVRPSLARVSLVCFDRYFHDLLADPRRYRHCGPSWLLRLACRLVPRPDLFLVLDVPVRELLMRKQEAPPAEIERQRAAYRRLAAELPNCILLPAQPSESSMEARSAEAILSYLRWRYGRRRHLWFPPSRDADWSWLEAVLCAGTRPSGDPQVSRQSPSREHWKLSLRDGRAYLLPRSPPRCAIAALRLYGARTAKARAAKCLLAAGLATGLIRPLLPRPAEELEGARCDHFLPDHLRELLGRQELEFAVSLGTPSSHRKPVIQLLEKSGRSLAFAKIGWDPTTCALVSNEAKVLRSMVGKDLSGLQLPAVLHLERWHGRLVCLQSCPPVKEQEAGQDLGPGCLAALHALASLDSRRLPLDRSAFWASLGSRLSRLESGWPGQALRALGERAAHRFAELQLPFHFCHGDFVPWNALALDGRLFLFDWEYAQPDWLPGYDLIHFLIQTRLRLAKNPPARVYGSALEQMTRSAALRGYWKQLGIEQSLLPVLLLLYLLERAAYHAQVNPGDYPVLQKLLCLVQIGFADPGQLP